LVGEPPGEQVAGVARVTLVEVDGDELEAHRRAPLQQAQEVEHRVGVLAAGHRHHDAVACFDELPIVNGAAHLL